MKVLLIHSDFIEWEPKKKAIEQAERVEKRIYKVNEALVVFSSVEKSDEKNPKQVVKNAVNEILDVYKQVKAKNIVIYPFVHLSPNPSKPSIALEVLKGIESELKSKKFPVKRAQFGWYKLFALRCKGHPLAELLRDITCEGKTKEIPEALEKEKKLKSEWYIMEPNGKLHKIEIKNGKISGFNFKGFENLEKFAKHEMAKGRAVEKEPPHISLMKRLGLVGYEPGSDPGNMRYAPKGKLIKSLIEEWVTNSIIEYGAMEVETPIMYDYEHPALKKYLNRFPARQYTIETPNKKVFLRFSSCFGQFILSHDASISYRNLPMKIYEMASSFRVEQRGELAGLRRLRKFSMPDVHCFCKDMPQAKQELLKRLELAIKIQEGFNLTRKDFEFGLRIVKDFYDENKDYIQKIAKIWGKPMLVEMWDKRFFYFILKYEFNFVDNLDKAAALTTDQIDIENGERFDIQFTDKDNKRKHPIILHMSPSGAVERVMYALLEKAYKEQSLGKNPIFPLWLSPTQIRLCPVNDSFNKYCEQIADKLEKVMIRVDIDDRIESVEKKVRDGETEWIPFIIVVGRKEKKSGKLAVRFRETGKVKAMKIEEIIKYIKKETEGKPFRKLSLDRLLTKRPVFAL
jgi:threonyl-tRNA synthetase